MSYNSLCALPADCFRNNTNLQSLCELTHCTGRVTRRSNLQFNALTAIPPALFDPLGQLQSLCGLCSVVAHDRRAGCCSITPSRHCRPPCLLV